MLSNLPNKQEIQVSPALDVASFTAGTDFSNTLTTPQTQVSYSCSVNRIVSVLVSLTLTSLHQLQITAEDAIADKIVEKSCKNPMTQIPH